MSRPKKSERERSEPASPRAVSAHLWASSRDDFETFLVYARASAAEPPWFAIPLSRSEDEDSYTLTFDVANRRELSVDGGGKRLLIYGAGRAGRTRELRTCILSEDIDAASIEIAAGGPALEVRVQKKQRGPMSPGRTGP